MTSNASQDRDRAGRILIIDDSEVVLERAARTLEAAGFEVITTMQTVGATRHIKTCDVVLLDYHMPGLDGSEVLASLRNAAERSHSSCMFLLYTSDLEQTRAYARLGFDGALADKGNVLSLVTQLRTLMRVVRMRALKRAR